MINENSIKYSYRKVQTSKSPQNNSPQLNFKI